MPLAPGMPNPPGEVALTDLRSRQEWIFSLESPPQISSISEDNSIYIRNVAKKPGDFDEQRDWRMGRGWEEFSSQPSGFFDSKDAWTMSGQVFQTLQYQFARGLRNADFELRGSKAWKTVSSTAYISRRFRASASYNAAHVYLWIRRRGNPGVLTVELRSDSSTAPGTVLKTSTITKEDVTDTPSVLYDFAITAQSLVSGTDYHVVIYGDDADNEANHWEVAINKTGSDSHTSPDGSTWTPVSFGMYYRVTDADPKRTIYGFNFDGSMFAVTSYFDGTVSKLYVNGDRGKATSGGAASLTDSGKAWATNKWEDAYVRIIRGTGRGQIRRISSNSATQILVSDNFDINPDSTSEYAIYATEYFTEVTLSPTLGTVVAQPAVTSGVVYFPQGTGTNVLRMRWNAGAYEAAADSTNKADFLLSAYSEGSVIWRANNFAGTGSGGIATVSKAPVPAWGTNLTFGTALVVGENTFFINSIVKNENEVWVFKEDGPWFIVNDKLYRSTFGMDATPSPTNGVAAVEKNKLLYFNWLWSTERLYAGTLDDIGQDWRGVGLPNDRQGAVMWLEPVIGWLFQAVDAGAGGTSSVQSWDGLAWHEILRGYASGKRIRALKWQPCEGARGRLWTEIEGDYIFQIFPLNNANPRNDDEATFQHEFVIESSTIDMGQASALPKFWRSLTATVDNLGAGKTIDVDYQLDSDVGSQSWTPAKAFDESPESEIFLWEGNIRRFRYRLRANTDDELIPTVLRQIRPNGFARTPFRLVWNMTVRLGDIVAPNGERAPDPTELVRWLLDVARFPGRVQMTSVYQLLHEYHVVIPPPNLIPLSEEQPGIPWQGVGTISLMEA